MNVLFDTASAIGVVAMVTDTSVIKPGNSRLAMIVFAIALLSAIFFMGFWITCLTVTRCPQNGM